MLYGTIHHILCITPHGHTCKYTQPFKPFVPINYIHMFYTQFPDKNTDSFKKYIVKMMLHYRYIN